SLRAELMRKITTLDRIVDTRTHERVARALLRDHRIIPVRAMARTDEHLVVRLRKIIWIGDDAYLELELENPSREPYRVEAVEVHLEGEDRAGAFVLD